MVKSSWYKARYGKGCHPGKRQDMVKGVILVEGKIWYRVSYPGKRSSWGKMIGQIITGL
jgi:hypothetical protein